MVGRSGLEPPTSRLSGECSNQLSYTPKQASARPIERTLKTIQAWKLTVNSLRTLALRDFRLSSFFLYQVSLAIDLRMKDSCFHASLLLRKEVIQPHLPIRLPCYDFTPVIGLTLAGWLLAVTSPVSGATNSHGVTGGVYKARERIHRGMLIRDY